MNLILRNLRPRYLPQKESGIWGRELSFAQGERVFICAPSGSGKTSFAHLLYGLRRDAEGDILWGTLSPLNATEEQLAALRAQKLSIVFQDLRLFPQLSLWKNLLVKKALGSPVNDAELESWLERLGLSHRRDSPAQNLSYGDSNAPPFCAPCFPILNGSCWMNPSPIWTRKTPEKHCP